MPVYDLTHGAFCLNCGRWLPKLNADGQLPTHTDPRTYDRACPCTQPYADGPR